MLVKSLVKNENPIFYKIIKNAYKNGKISHAYLLDSAPDVDLSNEVLLIMQSVICETEHVFACGECQLCRRVANFTYADLHILDGQTSLIKKDAVLMAANALNQTSLEANGIKIFLIKSIDNTNKQSLNSLLKFIEEPTEDTLIIMTTHHINNVISTIVSRSQVIKMRPKSIDNLKNNLFSESIEERYLDILVAICKNKAEAIELYENGFIETYREIIASLKALVNSKELGRRSLSKALKKGNTLRVKLLLLNLFFNDIWKKKNGSNIRFNNESELLNRFIDMNFDYANAIKETWHFAKSLKSNANFELAKESYLIVLMEEHGK